MGKKLVYIFMVVFILLISILLIIFVYKTINKNEEFSLGKKVDAKKGLSSVKKSPLNVEWQQLQSPPGGGYWTITIATSDPKLIFIGTRDFNVIKTTDAGKTWKNLGEKLFGAHIFSNIAVHPSDPNTFFVSNGAIHYTNDGGTVWNAVSQEKTGIGQNEGVTALAYNTENPSIMYAGEGNDFYISSDGGKNWSKIRSVEGTTIRTIIKKDALYVMVSDSGVFKSVDDGKTWIQKNSGIDSFDYIYGMFNNRYLVYNEISSEFYLATENGLYVSVDGERWQKKGNFQNENAPLTIAAAGPIIYVTTESGKLYKSDDKGETWEVIYTAENIKTHNFFDYAVNIHYLKPNIVYVITKDRIVKSLDAGKTWQEISKEIYDDAFFIMDYAHDTETLWVGEYWTRGLFTTKDDGKTWKFIESWRETARHDHYPMSFDVNPLNGNEVYVSGAYGVKKTINNGENWTALGEGTFFFDRHIHGMSLDTNNPSIIYAGSAPGWEQENQKSQVFKSIDKGQTWKELTGFPSVKDNNVYAFAIKDNIIYAALNQHESGESEKHHNSLGVWKSLDAGKTWQDISSNLPNKNVFSIAFHPQNQDIVYAGLGHVQEHSSESEQGLFRSKDGGKSWQRVEGLPELQPTKIRFNPDNSNIILASYGEHICGACDSGYPKGAGIYGTIDNGETWYNLIPEGIFTERQLAVMDIVFKDKETIYAVTDDGIFKGKINF